MTPLEKPKPPWNPLDQPVDQATIAGHLTPGICEIVGADLSRRWDERAGYALNGAELVFHGIKLSHFSIKLRLYTAQDWADWEAFKPLVFRLPVLGRRTRGLDITHPLLADIGIRSIVVEQVLVPDQSDDGEWTIELKVIEFRGTPKPALAKAEGSKAAPFDQAEHDIQVNNETIDRLGREGNAGGGGGWPPW